MTMMDDQKVGKSGAVLTLFGVLSTSVMYNPVYVYMSAFVPVCY